MYIDISDIPFFPSSYLDNVLLYEGTSLGTDHFKTACLSTSQNSFSGMVKILKKAFRTAIFLSLTKSAHMFQWLQREEKHFFYAGF